MDSPLVDGAWPGVLHDRALRGVPTLFHGFTTRTAGSAPRPGTSEGGEPDAVARALATSCGTWTRRECVQVHGSRTWRVNEAADCPEADALVTRAPGDLLVVRTADCLPVLVAAVDPGSGRPLAVAAIHVGWRGLLAGVVEGALRALAELAPTARVVAALGPAIGPCCFEVGGEVVAAWRSRLGPGHVTEGPGGRGHADIPGAVRQVLRELDVEAAAHPPPCTRCRPDLFHSHRAAGPDAGRMAALIGMER